jgi:microcystin-dependent protein
VIDPDFDAPEKTGGEKTHTLTAGEMPGHGHGINFGVVEVDAAEAPELAVLAAGDYETIETGTVGGGQAHNNMPPYVTVYMWVRIFSEGGGDDDDEDEDDSGEGDGGEGGGNG